MTTTYLITGASRGIGLALVKAVLESDPNARTIAAVRDPASAAKLKEIIKQYEGRVETLQLDVSDPKSVEQAAVEVDKLGFANDGIDVVSLFPF